MPLTVGNLLPVIQIQTACLLSAGSLVVWYIKWVHATGNLLLLKQVTACPPGSLVVSCCLGCCVSLEITAIQKLSHCVRWSYVQRYTRPATLFRFSQSLVQTGQCKTIKKSHIWTGQYLQRLFGVKPHIYWRQIFCGPQKNWRKKYVKKIPT